MPTPFSSLAAAAGFDAWLVDAALPWAGPGRDGPRGSLQEPLAAKGEPWGSGR